MCFGSFHSLVIGCLTAAVCDFRPNAGPRDHHLDRVCRDSAKRAHYGKTEKPEKDRGDRHVAQRADEQGKDGSAGRCSAYPRKDDRLSAPAAAELGAFDLDQSADQGAANGRPLTRACQIAATRNAHIQQDTIPNPARAIAPEVFDLGGQLGAHRDKALSSGRPVAAPIKRVPEPSTGKPEPHLANGAQLAIVRLRDMDRLQPAGNNSLKPVIRKVPVSNTFTLSQSRLSPAQ